MRLAIEWPADSNALERFDGLDQSGIDPALED